MKYPFPGLTKSQRRALDLIGCGECDAPGVGDTDKLKLLENGLIRFIGKKVICRDRFGVVTVNEFAMPISVHILWCEWQSEQWEKLSPEEKAAIEAPDKKIAHA